MKMKTKKVLSLLLALLMALSMCHVVVLAAEDSQDAFMEENTKIRIAGKIDLFGLDLKVDPSYNAVLTVYKGYEGYSSEEEAGIHIATKEFANLGTVDKWIDVGNVGIEAIQERMEGTQVDTANITYDWIYNALIDPVLSNIAKQTIKLTYGEKTSTYTIAQTKSDGYQTLTMTADSVDFAEDYAALTDDGTIALVYNENANEALGLFMAQGSYVRLGNQKRTLTQDTTVDALDATGEVNLEQVMAVLNGDIEETVTLAANDGKAVLQFNAGTKLTVGKTSLTLNQPIRLTVEGLGIEDNLIDKLVRVTEGKSDVTLTDYTGLTSLIPTSAGTLTITAEVDPEEEVELEVDTTSEAFVMKENGFAGKLTDAVKTTNSSNGDTIQLNANYENTAVALTNAIGSTGTNTLTLDMNGKNLTGSGTQTVSLGSNKVWTVLNTSNTATVLENTKATTGIALRAGGGVLTIGAEGADNNFTVRAATAVKSDNNTATIVIYGGTFEGAINQNKGTISIYGGTFDTDPSAYVAEGYEAVDNSNGTWTVLKKAEAAIGNVRYTTLEEAVAAATSGDTIVLLNDVDLSDHARSSHDDIVLDGVTLDLGGKTIRGFNSGVRYSGEGAVIKNGTFDFVAAEAKPNYALSIGSYNLETHSTMTLQDLTVNGGVNVDCADVTLEDVNINASNNVYYCLWVDEDGASATYRSGTIDGNNVQYAVFGAAKVKNDAVGVSNGILNVVGGVINANDRTLVLASGSNIFVSGGSFDKDVLAKDLVDGYVTVLKNERYEVGRVVSGEINEKATPDEGYAATYTLVRQVLDSEEAVLSSSDSITVNVMAVTENTAAADTAVEKLDAAALQTIIGSVVASADTEETVIEVQIEVERDEPTLVGTGDAATITYEVHPIAKAYAGGNSVGSVEIGNEALAEGASFTITLPVPAELAATGRVKVTHISNDYDDETASYAVQGDAENGYFVTFIVTHFSQFELAIDPLESCGTARWGASLSLEDAVEINLYVGDLKNAYGSAETEPERFKVVYTFKGVRKEKALESAVNNKIVVASCAAKELADEVHLELYYDDVLIKETDYSAQRYCDDKIEENTDAKLVELCYALLEYGAYAQQRFQYNTENLANSNHYRYYAPTIISYPAEYELDMPDYYGVVEQLGASLLLESKTAINVYFKPLSGYTASDYTVTAGGTPLKIVTSYTANGELCKVTVPGIAAKDLGTKIDIVVSNGYNDFTLQYAPMTYAVTKWIASEEHDVCHALYCYYVAAKDYFGE